MRKETSLEILKQNLADLQEANKWLVHSYQICERLRDRSDLKVPEYDAIESFLVTHISVICYYERYFALLTLLSWNDRGLCWMC